MIIAELQHTSKSSQSIKSLIEDVRIAILSEILLYIVEINIQFDNG